MTSGEARTSDSLRNALRRYLARNPEAADSLEGIRRWWLPEALRSLPDDKLQQSLHRLIATGEMQVRALPDGTELYARSATKRPSAGRGEAH